MRLVSQRRIINFMTALENRLHQTTRCSNGVLRRARGALALRVALKEAASSSRPQLSQQMC